MASVKASAAVSHVGRVRANNQDSGYAGRRLFLVADGMGGHAGGDVASAIATKRIAEADGDYAVFVEQSWLTNRAISDKSPTGFKVTFATPAPPKATIDWMLVR